MIRPATEHDADAMAELAALRRQGYAEAQPQFWRVAEGAVPAQRVWFTHLIADTSTLTLVAKRSLLDAEGLGIASTWHVGSLT